MRSGRAVIFESTDRPLKIEQFPVADPKGAEVLVRTVCCSLCSSDLHTHAGRRQGPTPTVLGHEIIGRIEAFGPDAPRTDFRGTPLAPGDRVTWTVAASCGTCFFCKEDLPQKCDHLFKYGHEQMSPQSPFVGGLAEYVLLKPGTASLRVPDQLSDALAAPANCATATVAAVLRCGGVANIARRTVLIFGAGVLGLTACAMARSAGARSVLVCDPDAERRARGADFGATHGVSSNPIEL